jgi:hypothetical protein
MNTPSKHSRLLTSGERMRIGDELAAKLPVISEVHAVAFVHDPAGIVPDRLEKARNIIAFENQQRKNAPHRYMVPALLIAAQCESHIGPRLGNARLRHIELKFPEPTFANEQAGMACRLVRLRPTPRGDFMVFHVEVFVARDHALVKTFEGVFTALALPLST